MGQAEDETKYGSLLLGNSAVDHDTAIELKNKARECLKKRLDNLEIKNTDERRIRKDLEDFQLLFSRFLTGLHSEIQWESIKPPESAQIAEYDSLRPPPSETEAKALLQKIAVVKLNGGLGTSMGCQGPKSIIPVRGKDTFLDLAVAQVEHLNQKYDVDIPLILMNSFSTDEDTQKILTKYSGKRVKIESFLQSAYPRVSRDTLMPIADGVESSKEAWYPPGHGNFYQAFCNSGLLDKVLQEGKKYVFVSNIDNVGATLDLNILGLCLDQNHEFVMEVTAKTPSDVKGGTLIKYEEKLRLLEIAQVPKSHVKDFESFKIFNTNNLWINLKAIKRLTENNNIDMEIIANPKELENGLKVLQLETAVGAAMKSFQDGIGVSVPRSRFLPVKKTSDLLLIMSNLYSVDENGSFHVSSKRTRPALPSVKLDDKYFKKVDDFIRHFEVIPDIVDLDRLEVIGDVTFGEGVVLSGDVKIESKEPTRIERIQNSYESQTRIV